MAKRRKLSPAERGWITRRAHEAQREREREQQRRSDAARRGWERRRREEEERQRIEAMRARQRERERIEEIRRKAGKKAAQTRRRRAEEAAEKEARRLAKWRKSYREYLKFRIPKAEREELAVPEKRELVCKVLFDSEEEGTEHFWSNIRSEGGDSISNQLARIPSQSGVVRVTFRWIEESERAEDLEDPSELGTLNEVEWDSDFDLEEFWRTYFDNAREQIPVSPEGKSGNGSLLVVKMQVCYYPGKISAD